MSLIRAWRVLRKDLRMGPRSPIFLWALVLPVVITILIVGVFGSLFNPSPRLGIADLGQSELTSAALALEGTTVELVESEERLLEMVEANDLDAGLILQPNFDQAVRAGEQPLLQFYVGGRSLASNRIVLGVTAIDLVREIAGSPAPVGVEITSLGKASLPIEKRLLPMIVAMAVAIAGVMVPASSLVEEKEKRTLEALLVTPTQVGDVFGGKAGVGIILALLTGLMTLVLNDAFGQAPAAMMLTLLLAAVMMAEFGLILGSWAKDTNTLFTAWKTGGILLLFPVIFYIWPGLPQWIAKLGPTYYFLQPVFELTVQGAALPDVWVELVIGAGIVGALLPFVFFMARRLELRLGT